MYSVVLLMALSGSADTPAALGHHGCNGCDGGCNGCDSGHGHGGGFRLFRHRDKCDGCNGCNGGGGHHGGCDGCNGCNGGHGHGGGFLRGLFKHRNKCDSCNGCNGGCNGGACNGGCAGACVGNGGCGGGACAGNGCAGGCPGGTVVVPGHGAPPVGEPVPLPKKDDGKKTGVDSPAPATIVVTVPAEAKLTIDGNATTSTSARRVFVSPALNPGQEYVYTVQAEFAVNGQSQIRTERVSVRAGEESTIDLTGAAVASK